MLGAPQAYKAPRGPGRPSRDPASICCPASAAANGLRSVRASGQAFGACACYAPKCSKRPIFPHGPRLRTSQQLNKPATHPRLEARGQALSRAGGQVGSYVWLAVGQLPTLQLTAPVRVQRASRLVYVEHPPQISPHTRRARGPNAHGHGRNITWRWPSPTCHAILTSCRMWSPCTATTPEWCRIARSLTRRCVSILISLE